MIVVGGQLAAGPDDSHKAEDQCIHPARAARETMTAADNDRGNKRWDEDAKLDNGDPAACVQVHSAIFDEVCGLEWRTDCDQVQCVGNVWTVLYYSLYTFLSR